MLLSAWPPSPRTPRPWWAPSTWRPSTSPTASARSAARSPSTPAGDAVHGVGRRRPHHGGAAAVRHDRRPGEAGAGPGPGGRANAPV